MLHLCTKARKQVEIIEVWTGISNSSTVSSQKLAERDWPIPLGWINLVYACLLFFFFFLVTVYCLFSCVICIWLNESALFQSWYALWAVSEGMAESKPSCCSWTDLLYSCCLNDVQLFTAGTVSDMVTLVMSSLLCGLICFLRAVGLELQLCSVAPSGITAEGRRIKAEVADRGQRKQGREQHSSSISGSCWVSRVTGAVTCQCASVFLVAVHSQGPAVSWIQENKA